MTNINDYEIIAGGAGEQNSISHLRQNLHKSARIAYLVLLLDRRSPDAPPKRTVSTIEIAKRLGVTQRSIQRDFNQAERVRAILAKFPDR